MLLLEGEHPHELPGVHGGGADVAGLARAHDDVQGFDGFLDRCLRVESMNDIEIDIVGTQTPERGVDACENMFSRQTLGVGFVAHRMEDFRGDHDVIACRKVAEGAA